ncbi:MAG: transcription-repair coupling factor [Bacteroidota bacterium]
MDLKELSYQYKEHPKAEEFLTQLEKSHNIYLQGIAGSIDGLFASGTIEQNSRPYLFIFGDKEEAAYFFNDIQYLLPEQQTFFFSSSFKRSIQFGQEDPTNIILRTELLNAINNNERYIAVTYPEAIIERVISRKEINQKTLEIHTSENISSDFLNDVLFEYDFEQVDFVYEPGQFSVRGSIIDIFSFSADHPYRIDFFGDQVESIRSFDVESQLSIKNYEKATIQPKLQDNRTPGQNYEWQSIFQFIHNETILWIKDKEYISERLTELFEKTLDNNPDKITDKQIISGKQFIEGISQFKTVEYGTQKHSEEIPSINLNASPPPAFNKNFNLLSENLIENQKKGYTNYILSDNEKQIERLQSIFEDINPSISFEPVNKTLHEGFIDHDLKICCYTDHQIFGRYHKYRLKSGFSKKEKLNIEELNNLHPGDYVVHVDHGIGKFGGLAKIDVNGKMQEAVRLIYKDNDVLYVNIHSLHKISKYKGSEGEPPKIYKLGSAAWKNLKNKTKRKVKDIAKELIQLYAQRKEKKGYQFSADSYLQQELESSFIYEDTPDQLESTKSVKTDMEKEMPMDRLVCGDVGFGKTEIAVRAAFKAVADSKQVAILVPTTILALQHYQTFTERLKDFPATIEHISRLRSNQKQKEIKEELAQGKIDIIIGTHRLIGKDIQFSDLGLLVIDEEQKFGVAVKEKLKRLKLNVDTLTLTATPIPRTLQFSLMGARDLSIIHTPPPNRYPIVTEVHTFNDDIIKEAIEYEFQRNGQVFFINNRIQNIYEIEKLVNKISPDVRTVVAHGQMEGAKLEKIMRDFINYEYDVLIATTIIESGLDIPNANTMIINEAHKFGLSDLHQLRGRVGRSNRKAFCYLLAPPLTSVTPDARRRLKAIEEFSELGSGFNISMQDLDIRGAGNLLGSEQSGFIADIGFETYHRILNEALLELKENDFQDLYKEEQEQSIKKQEKSQRFILDSQIETDLQILIPDDYISNTTERINLYRELDNINDEDALKAFEKKLTDRFGPIPDATRQLLELVRLRWLAIDLGFEKVMIKNNTMVLHFISNQNSIYYQSPTFMNIIQYVQKQHEQFQIKEGKKLTMTVKNIKDIYQALKILQEIKKNS